MRLLGQVLEWFFDLFREVPHDNEHLESEIARSNRRLVEYRDLVRMKRSPTEGQGRYEKWYEKEKKHLDKLLSHRNRITRIQPIH